MSATDTDLCILCFAIEAKPHNINSKTDKRKLVYHSESVACWDIHIGEIGSTSGMQDDKTDKSPMPNVLSESDIPTFPIVPCGGVTTHF